MKTPRSAMSCALTLLERRDYSVWELIRKLEGKGYPREEIDEAVTRLREWNYLDDERYLRRKIEKYREEKKSRTYTRQRLSLAGLEPNPIEEGLDRFYPPAAEAVVVRFWWENFFTGECRSLQV